MGANQDKTVFQRKEEDTRQNAENDVSTVGESELVNKEPSNNEDSHDIKPSVYKKAESVTDEAKVSNGKYDDLDSAPISKEESSIKSRKGDEANQDKTVFQRKEEEPRQNAENDVSTVGESELVNKEPNNNEGSHDIKPSVYKKAESVTDEIKMNNAIRNSSLRIDDLSPMQNRKKPKLLKYLQKVGGAVKKLLVHEAEIILL